MVITDRARRRSSTPAPPEPGRRSFADRPEFRRRPARATLPPASEARERSATASSTSPCRSPPAATIHGAVRVTYPTSKLDERIRNYWLALAGIAAIVLGVATLVGLRFAHWIRRPLEGLEEAAARAGAGDLAHAPRARRTRGDSGARARVQRHGGAGRRARHRAARLRRGCLPRAADAADGAPSAAREPRTPRRRAGRSGVAAATDEVTPLAPRRLAARARPCRRGVPRAEQHRPRRARPRARRSLAPDPRTRGPAGARRDRTGPGTRWSERVAQVLDNLIANALRAAPDERRSRSRFGSRCRASAIVRDRGPGMTQEEKTRAFDRFWRAGSGGRLGARPRDRPTARRARRRHDRASRRAGAAGSKRCSSYCMTSLPPGSLASADAPVGEDRHRLVAVDVASIERLSCQ